MQFTRGSIKQYFRGDSRLIGVWSLFNLTDESGGGLHLTTGANAPVAARGKFHPAYRATNQQNSFLYNFSNPGINGGVCSLIGTFKFLSHPPTNTVWPFMQGGFDNGSTVGYGIWYEDLAGTKRLVFYRRREGIAFDTFIVNGALELDHAYTFAITYDGSTLRGYIDGNFVGSVGASGVGNQNYTYGAIQIFGVSDHTNPTAASDMVGEEVALFKGVIEPAKIKGYCLWANSRRTPHPALLQIGVLATIFTRTASASVSNAVSRFATVSRSWTLVRKVSVSVSNAAGRLATVMTNYITKIKNLITNVFKWDFSTWT